MSNLFRLKGSSLEEIRRKALAQHGPAARIVSAERVISPGIAGLFAGHRYEAMVEVTPETAVVYGEVLPGSELLGAEDPARVAPGGALQHQLDRSAIAALLNEADAEESRIHRPAAAASGVSTASPDFAGLLEQLGSEFQVPVTAPAPDGSLDADRHSRFGEQDRRASLDLAPRPLTGAGNLVVLLGIGRDAIETAVGMSIASGGADVRTAGELNAYGHLHVDGRLSATAARAQAVLTGQTVLVAFGLGKPTDVETRLPLIRSLYADQMWLVVDAGRKPEDTAAWTRTVTDTLPVNALAVTGAADTLTPRTVNGLGIPIGWVDGAASAGPML